MTQINSHFQQGLTTSQILVRVFATLTFLMVGIPFFFPWLFRSHAKADQSSCASNMKQIGIATLSYAQDYDDRLPPATVMIETETATVSSNANRKEYRIPRILRPFVKNPTIFQCRNSPSDSPEISYMYNDLASGEQIADCSRPAFTLLFAEGENRRNNAGHAKSDRSNGDDAVLVKMPEDTSPQLALGAAIGDASTRHSQGADYLYVDGHVRWLKPQDVFFPPRESDSPSYRDPKTGEVFGPNPQGQYDTVIAYQGRFYKATFHVR